jgi:hypothetical protein
VNRTGRNRWINFFWYQALWLTAVAGGTPVTLALLFLLALHLLWVECWRSELMLMVGCALPGCVADGLLVSLGVFVFVPTPSPGPIPLWLIAIWLGFAGTLRGSLRWLSTRPPLMAVLAGVGAPLAYLSAARLGAVTFPLGALQTGGIIGAVWVALSPWLCWLTRQSYGWQSGRLATRSLYLKQEIDDVK